MTTEKINQIAKECYVIYEGTSQIVCNKRTNCSEQYAIIDNFEGCMLVFTLSPKDNNVFSVIPTKETYFANSVKVENWLKFLDRLEAE